MKAKITENCISCGACANTCPVGAISMPSQAHVDPSKCIGCGACIGICPVEAIIAVNDAPAAGNKGGK